MGFTGFYRVLLGFTGFSATVADRCFTRRGPDAIHRPWLAKRVGRTKKNKFNKNQKKPKKIRMAIKATRRWNRNKTKNKTKRDRRTSQQPRQKGTSSSSKWSLIIDIGCNREPELLIGNSQLLGFHFEPIGFLRFIGMPTGFEPNRTQLVPGLTGTSWLWSGFTEELGLIALEWVNMGWNGLEWVRMGSNGCPLG